MQLFFIVKMHKKKDLFQLFKGCFKVFFGAFFVQFHNTFCKIGFKSHRNIFFIEIHIRTSQNRFKVIFQEKRKTFCCFVKFQKFSRFASVLLETLKAQTQMFVFFGNGTSKSTKMFMSGK